MIVFENLGPKIYINSFPKSGTHLAILITMHMAQIQKPKHWLGSFRDNSWTDRWLPFDKYIQPVIEGQQPGTWMMGHMGYKPEIEQAFKDAGTCMIFVYRDLRDVAVSQTYHIEDERDEISRHPDKPLYMALPSHTDRLRAVIEGLDRFPGIIDRWELFAPWLGVDWVLPIKYEDMRERPKFVANLVVDYVVRRTSEVNGELPFVVAEDYKKAIDKAIEQMGTTDKSGSFRAGRVGDWRQEFTPELVELWERLDKGWVVRLGYERTGKARIDRENAYGRIAVPAQVD